jgi:hypothetical protein
MLAAAGMMEGEMRRLALLLGGSIFLASGELAVAQTCSDGTAAEAAGTIIRIDEDTMFGGWMVTVDVATANCFFAALWFEEKPPAQCAEGTPFKARGEIAEAQEITLDVMEINCGADAG